MSYPIVTTTVLKHKSVVAFPGVTICNMNRQFCF